MITGYHSTENLPGHHPKAIFEVPLQGDQKVYMSIARTNFQNDDRCIVVVNAAKFLALWRKEPCSIHLEQSMGTPETWIKDKKYPDAITGFSYGIKNPVPVPDVVCNDNNGFEYVAFTNGVTRTIWLLSHKAEYFPVECRLSNGADRLVKEAGYSNKDILSVDLLLPDR